ncbi:hypothetical protein M2336_001769 [Sphingobium sp. B1D7B]|uniref:hypothetical protein n=1 Tax=Sphingobium sp. B1D7B TaxID=2940578 RepID=UPI0022257589|nr:hypothetical protein [Sphingobium sp. B1D7B]MCW2405140.1 hypothetical protein [Sphingobium sp. B1D7B]
MAARKSLVHPVLFSTYFGVPAEAFALSKLLDPILNSDTKLFIDPLLLWKSQHPLIMRKGRSAVEVNFQNVIGLLDISRAEGDVAWRGAYKALNLDERAETSLGYGAAGTSGSSRPPALRHSILRTAKEIITLGEKNPTMIPLMGLFETGVGPDTLSDMTTNFLLPTLAEITEDFCITNDVPVKAFGEYYGNRKLPENPFHPGSPVILVPRDLLRDLPLAADWTDVSRVILEVREIREAVNRMFGNFAKATIAQKKAAIRRAAFSSPTLLRKLIDAVALASESYDEKADLDGYYQFRKILSEDPEPFRGRLVAPPSKDATTLLETVKEIMKQFQEMVEDNNMWELLWNGNIARHERASQLLFFAVANVMCAVNNVDISPETNSGGGPVDFKFSSGYRGRVLVEIKLSTGSVVHGYKTQLEIYKKASRSADAIFVIMDIGKMGRKLWTIEKLKRDAEARGERASDIIVIDAHRQRSASKR